MKLRSQIILFLFLFGLAPLVAEMVFNLPLVFSNLQEFYHKAYLQSLRADFRDLDQHSASRHEMVRLLAKLPEVDGLIGSGRDRRQRDAMRMHFTRWVNRVIRDQLDVIQILLLDRHGKPQFWLERDPKDMHWVQGRPLEDLPPQSFVEAGLGLKPGTALVSALTLNPHPQRDDPRGFMTLRLISPIYKDDNKVSPELAGAVVITIDVGGMAQAYSNTYWVLNDGTYLRYTRKNNAPGGAFEDFPGLKEIFERGRLALWEGPDNEQVIWLPLFYTEQSGPLWVGRQVDPSPITSLRRQLELRVAGIVLLLMIIVLLAARWIAVRIERFGRDLTDGIGRVLTSDEPVRFAWAGPPELRVLADNLTRLAETHARNSRALRAHALELERSNRYKSEFLANVSHELRTPLNSILLLSKLLAEDAESCRSPEQARHAAVIHAAGKDLTHLIDDILDLSRIEAGKAVLQPEPVDLTELLKDLLELVRPQFDAKGLSLDLEVAPGVPVSIVSDPHKIRQIIKNFLSNAVKFTSTGGVRVRISANSGEYSTPCPLRISVQDTGIGIVEDKQDVIFEAFNQADGSTSRRYGGTGLGLTISRELAGLLGGRIELESGEGQGATFSLLLPLRFEHEMEVEEVASKAGARQQASSDKEEAPLPEADFSGRRVLVVDDDVRNLLALTPILERWGMEVTGAGDGEEALEALEDDGFDVVLMDIMMPGMDGYETIARIRREPRYAHLPIIALTARTAPEDRDRCMEVGASGFLAKPVDPATLKEALEQSLGADGAKPA